MHIALFCQHYHTPDCPTAARPYSLVQQLARRHTVTLVASDAWRRQRLTSDFPWVPEGVRLLSVDVPYTNCMTPLRRLRSFASYAAQALWHGLRMPSPDVVYATSTPLTAPCVAAAVARHHDVPWLFEVRDLWPDFPIQMGALPSGLARRALYGLERTLYRDAAHVVTASSDMEAHVRRYRDEGVTTVEYGVPMDLLARVSDADVEALRGELGLGDRRVVLYAGSFGQANDLPSVMEAARALRDRDDVCFVLAGRGHYASRLEAGARGLPNVRLLPPQPLPRALALFCLADLSLIPFVDRPVLAANSPSKLYDSLAAGTPVVVTNAGWTKALVEQHACGWYVPPEQPAVLAARVRSLMDAPGRLRQAGDRGARLARERFDRARHVERIERLVERVVRPPASPASIPVPA